MESVTDSISRPKESVGKLEIEENVEICPKSKEKLAQIEEHEQDITEAEPLAWIPASAGQLQDPLLVPSYVDGKIFDLPEGWIVERRPRTSLNLYPQLQFYYEPDTKKQFRSLKAAQEHAIQQPPRPQSENKFEPGARSMFQRFKDLHMYLQARKGDPIVVQGDQQPKVSHEKANENSGDEQNKKRKQALDIESDFPNPPKKVECILTDAPEL
ncbi:hypothetical protein V6N13_006037 [Hibiscus sabdariffa]